MLNNLPSNGRHLFSPATTGRRRGGFSGPFPVISWIVGRATPGSPSSSAALASPIHRTLSLSHSHELWARRAISTAQIRDACNYCTIYSNQADPNLYFPEAMAGLQARSYLPGRHSPAFVLFNQASTPTAPAERGQKKGEGPAVPLAF